MGVLEVPTFSNTNKLVKIPQTFDMVLKNVGAGSNNFGLPYGSVGSVVGAVFEPKIINMTTDYGVYLSVCNKGVQLFNGSICGNTLYSTPNIYVDLKEKLVSNNSSNIGSVYNCDFTSSTGAHTELTLGSPWKYVDGGDGSIGISGNTPFGKIGVGSILKIHVSNNTSFQSAYYNFDTIVNEVTGWLLYHGNSGIQLDFNVSVGKTIYSAKTTADGGGDFQSMFGLGCGYSESGTNEGDIFFSPDTGSVFAQISSGEWYKFKLSFDAGSNTGAIGMYSSGTTPILINYQSGITYNYYDNPIRSFKFKGYGRRGDSYLYLCDLRTNGNYDNYVSGTNNLSFEYLLPSDGVLSQSSNIYKYASVLKLTQEY